jgi:lipopolysaccharide biosynthesis glycosyltransferase
LSSGLRFCRIETGDTFAGLNLDRRRTEATYLRLAIPDAFAADYQRILYLDSDVFLQGGNFSALMDLDIGPHAIAAVRDNSQWRTPGRRIDSFAKMGLPAVPYFNAGVLLIDTAAVEAQRIRERSFAFARAHPGKLAHMDQDMLNGAVMGEWAEISPVWNWQYTWASRLFEAMVGANVVPFIGRKKPWNHIEGEMPLRFRHAYRDFFAAHFPDAAPLGDDGVLPLRNRAFLRKALGKHLVATGKMCAYLDRFPDELTVIR